MTYACARLFAAAMRSVGINAKECPPSDQRTLELGGLYSSGEECYPQKITLGDFLQIVDAPDFDRDKHAFFMPTANGPCRFGQYGPYFRQVLDDMGYHDVPVVSPTSDNGYEGVGGEKGMEGLRTMWRGIICGDLLRKMLLKTRPYETRPGAADEAFEASLTLVDEALAVPDMSMRAKLAELASVMAKCRDLFRNVPARYEKGRPLIGIVGEIFCRLNTFSNEDACRQIEAQGGECWLSDMVEWVLYTNWEQQKNLRRKGKRFSLSMLGAKLKDHIQRGDEHALAAPFAEDFEGYEEPADVKGQVLEPAWPYLPADGALGEMVLSVGKSIYLHGKGADGIIDISPFSCMNGIVSEAVYHDVSADYDHLPIRNFYFDASSSNLSRDLEIFMELARGYQKHKTQRRRYPAFFE